MFSRSKDMSLLRHAQEMADAGITTFKIEGRMKRPEYVAAVVTACREALTGETYDEDTLRAVFSRSGFTDGYLTGKRDKTMFGYRTKDDVQSADKVLKSLAALYEKETPRVGVSMAFSLTEAESTLTVSDGANTCAVTGAAPEKAISRSLDAASAEKNLVKTGGTPFAVTDFAADIAPGYMLPASALNALRREALSKLLEARGAAKPWPRSGAPAPATPEKRDRDRTGELWARFESPSQIPAGESFDKILLPVERITPEIIETFGERLIGVLPPILWPADEETLEARLAALKDAGLREVYGDNIYAIPLTRRRGLALHGGAGLNILNTEALRHYEEEGLASVTASFELSMRGIKSLGGSIPIGAIVYGRLPLMHFRNCPLRAQIGCTACRARGELTDRRGVKFPVECGGEKVFDAFEQRAACTLRIRTCAAWITAFCGSRVNRRRSAPPSRRITAREENRSGSAPADCTTGSFCDRRIKGGTTYGDRSGIFCSTGKALQPASRGGKAR